MASRIGSLLLVTAAAAPLLWPQAAVYPASKQGGEYMFNYYLPPAPSTSPWAPAWAPDGKSIAVAMQGSIWKVDPATGSATELTTTASIIRRQPGRLTENGSSTPPMTTAKASNWRS
ncbi:MAG TPA: hypothetical protein VLX58_18015 [Bryobacteraceae bacterium]|nr:hypothetical protein [Bryobacteraceae bacterium]